MMDLENMVLPSSLTLAYKNTPIVKMDKLSKRIGKNIYIKRDDMTGIELSGNKVRKLEYALKEAIDCGAKVVITCGAIQSNHARATVVACRKLGLEVHLVLRGEPPKVMNGNFLINQIMGAKVTFLSAAEFADHHKVMASLRKEYELQGIKSYVIPVGASNGIGNFGYFNAYQEILTQESKLGIEFDAIACTVGSGGTYSGLCLANMFNTNKKEILGYSVGGSEAHFIRQSDYIIEESIELLKKIGNKIENIQPYNHNICDEYQGEGYAITNKTHIEFIKWIARFEGILLDPVYTGKCFFGLVQDINSNKYDHMENILFIHTGGIFGIDSYEHWFK